MSSCRLSGITRAGLVQLLGATLALVTGGCTPDRAFLADSSTHVARECAPPPISEPFGPALSSAETPQIESFSPRFYRIAAAMGLISLLQEAVLLEQQRAAKRPGADLELIRIRQQILARTVLATLEATSLAGVVRCELARADQLADSLAEKEANSRQLATIVSLIIESATMIATGGLILAGHEVAEGITALIGGTIAATVAGVSLYQPAKHDFHHPRNILKEIWENPKQAQYFPGPVWRFLNEPTEDGRSLREQLVASWKELGRIEGQSEAQHQEQIRLLFGIGGSYTIDDLRSRAAMLEMLAAAIDLMHDELELLVREMLVREEETKLK